ncbi:MAG: hypothetical protein FJ253_03595 [Phycisphaerae bacterium]|nr:hypothetical protein [Phycisphaerae bacterium]
MGCYLESLERFRSRRLADRPMRRRASELSDEQRASMRTAAEQLARERPMALAEAISILAERQSLEPRRVRRFLASTDLPFGRRRRRAREDVRLAFRAWRRGIDPRRIARRIGRDKAATWRAVNAGRRAALRALSLPRVELLPTFELPMAEEVLLAPESIRHGLHSRPLPDESATLLERTPPISIVGRTGELDACRRLVAMRFLLWRASRGIAALPAAPTSHALDRIETDLRFACLLRRTLLVHCLPAALGRLEAMLRAPLASIAEHALASALRRVGAVTMAAIDAADSLEAAEARLRVARHAALVVDRELARSPIVALERRAIARVPGRTPPRVDLEALVEPWRDAANSWCRCAERAASLPRVERSLLERRFGWNGSPPLTVRELAREEAVSPSLLQRRLTDAWAKFGTA